METEKTKTVVSEVSDKKIENIMPKRQDAKMKTEKAKKVKVSKKASKTKQNENGAQAAVDENETAELVETIVESGENGGTEAPVDEIRELTDEEKVALDACDKAIRESGESGQVQPKAFWSRITVVKVTFTSPASIFCKARGRKEILSAGLFYENLIALRRFEQALSLKSQV